MIYPNPRQSPSSSESYKITKKLLTSCWSKNKSTSNKSSLKMITCLWNASVLLIWTFNPLISGSKDSNHKKPCLSFISIRKPVLLKILSLSMKILKNSTKPKKYIPTKTKRANRKVLKALEDFGSKMKKLITGKSSDGKFSFQKKMQKNGLKKSSKPLNYESRWTPCFDSIIMSTICQLKTLIICKPIFKQEFWEKFQLASKKNKLILWCKKWIKHL